MPGISRVVVLTTGLVVACAPANPGRAPAHPHPTPADSMNVELEPAQVDLTGNWATGSGNAPPPGPVVRYPTCAVNPAVWIIQQTGNVLKTWFMSESFNQGIKSAGPGPEKVAAIPGTISGTAATIDDGTVRLVLRYDRETGHLVGTRNGTPFWAARQTIVRTEACPGIPAVR